MWAPPAVHPCFPLPQVPSCPPLPAACASRSVTSASAAVVSPCGLGFLPQPRGGKGQRTEPRPGGTQSPEGRAAARPSLTFLPGTPDQPALHKDSESPRAHGLHERQKWTWMLCSSKYSSQRSRRGRRGASSSKVSPRASGTDRTEGLLPFTGREQGGRREGTFAREGSAGRQGSCFLPVACFCTSAAFANRARVLTGFCHLAAKFDISRSYDKINQTKEELSAAKVKLETKVSRCVYTMRSNGIYIDKCVASSSWNRFSWTLSRTVLHLPSHTAPRTLTPCDPGANNKGLPAPFPSHTSPCRLSPGCAQGLAHLGGVGAFPGNAFTAGRTAASTWAREESLLLRRERTATSGQPVHETQTPAVSRGGVAARVRGGQPSPRSPGACSRNSLRRPRNHPFVAHCPSLKACHRKSVQIHAVSSSQDLESLLKIFLCSPLGLSKAQGFFQGRRRQEESFGICLVFLRCHYASYLTKLQTYLPIKLPVLQSFSPLIPVVTDDLEFLLMPANEV